MAEYGTMVAPTRAKMAGDQTTDLAQQLVTRYNKLLEERRNFDVLAQDLFQFILPRKSQVTVRYAPGQKQTAPLYTTTAIKANQFLGSSMAGMMTPSTLQWFSLEMEESDLNALAEVKEWLDEDRLRIFSALNRSNFKSESHELYLDLGVCGTGVVLEEEIAGSQVYNGVRFRTKPFGSYVLAEGPDGKVDTVGCKYEMTVRAAALRFGKEHLSQRSQDYLAANKLDWKTTILHMVYPREGADSGRHVPATKRKYASCYIETGATEGYAGDHATAARAHEIAQGGFYELPYLVARWGKSSYEVYGRGPGHDALPAIKSENKAHELYLRAAGKWIDPPLGVVDDGVIGKVRTQPSGITTARSKDSIFEMPFGAKSSMPLAREFIEGLSTKIREIFFSDLLRMPQKQYMTATEVQAMLEEMQRALGPVVGRLESEFLAPLIDRTFAIMYRAGVLPTPPQVVVDAIRSGASSRINVVYVGPLARSQKFTDVTAIQRFLTMIQPVVQLSPTAWDNMDVDEFTRYCAAAVDLPPRLFRRPEQVEAIRQSQHQQMQQQQADQRALGAAKAIKDAGPTLTQMGQGAGAAATPPPAGGAPP